MRDPILNVAIQAARSAGNTMVRALKRLDTVKVTEKQPNDFVTDVDQRVEAEIIAAIKKAYPEHGIVGEESGEMASNESDYTWIIDPIDGTRNFIHGLPHFAVSIAVMHRQQILHGVIYDPVRQELFSATRGKGAQLNDHRIRIAQRKRLEECLFGTGFAFRHSQQDLERPYQILDAILPYCGDIRRTGSATLDLAYVAAGRLDGFWEFGLRLWDIAAGILLIREAGGMVCDPDGGEDYLKTGNVVAANPTIMRLFLKQTQMGGDKS